MKALILGSIVVCSVFSLSAGAPAQHAHEHMAPNPNDTYNITLLIKSGEVDPSWLIDRKGLPDNATLSKVIKLLNLDGHGKENTNMKSGGEVPTNLGYKGLSVIHLDSKNIPLHEWIIPVCSNPILEWNLVMKTAPANKVSLTLKEQVNQKTLKCYKANKAKKVSTSA